MRAALAGIGLVLTAATAFAEGEPVAPAAPTTMLSGGIDAWQRGAFGYAGGLWSPGGLDNEGFTLKAVAGGGTYVYRSGFLRNENATSDQVVVSLLPGWRFKTTGFELLVVAGLDAQNHRPSAPDATARLHGTYAGARIGADLWLQPTPYWMLAANASVSSISQSYWYRLAPGVRLAEIAWIGPEAQLFGDAHYTQSRAGLHVTGLRTGPLEWAGAIGYAEDSERKRGAYVRIGVLARR